MGVGVGVGSFILYWDAGLRVSELSFISSTCFTVHTK